MTTSEQTLYFYSLREPFGEFSNFSPHGIKMEGQWWPTTEHYFQAQKFDDPAYRDQIRAASDPKQAADWDAAAPIRCVRIGSRSRTTSWHGQSSKSFRRTPPCVTCCSRRAVSPIVENAPGDYYWGCGKDGTGQNRLGQILMQVREALRAESV